MSATAAVFRREFRGYFATPLAYVFLVAFLASAAFMPFSQRFFDSRDASLRLFFSNLPALFAFFAPAVAMRMWAEERRTGTIELLLTLPVTLRQAVLGKFLAGWAFFGIALVLTFSMVVTVAYLGNPDPGPIFVGYLGALLMAGAYLAIGTFFSALTKNQVIAFVLGTAASAAFVWAGSPAVSKFLDGSNVLSRLIGRFVESMSFLTHYDPLQKGLLTFGSLAGIATIGAGFLVATMVLLQDTKSR
jgi:ABC-2 type transport system permease protein